MTSMYRFLRTKRCNKVSIPARSEYALVSVQSALIQDQASPPSPTRRVLLRGYGGAGIAREILRHVILAQALVVTGRRRIRPICYTEPQCPI